MNERWTTLGGAMLALVFATGLLFPRNAALFAGGWRVAVGIIGLVTARVERG